MQSLFLVVLLAAAATAAVVSNEVPEVVEVPERVEGDEVADVDVMEKPLVIMSNVDELPVEDGLIDETAVDPRLSLSWGVVYSTDTLAYSGELSVNAVANSVRVREVVIRTNQPICGIRVNPVSPSQKANPTVRSGGLNQYFVTIRIESAVGRGFDYTIRIYVR